MAKITLMLPTKRGWRTSPKPLELVSEFLTSPDWEGRIKKSNPVSSANAVWHTRPSQALLPGSNSKLTDELKSENFKLWLEQEKPS